MNFFKKNFTQIVVIVFSLFFQKNYTIYFNIFENTIPIITTEENFLNTVINDNGNTVHIIFIYITDIPVCERMLDTFLLFFQMYGKSNRTTFHRVYANSAVNQMIKTAIIPTIKVIFQGRIIGTLTGEHTVKEIDTFIYECFKIINNGGGDGN